MPPPRPSKDGAWLKGQADDLASLANLDDAVLLEELRVRYDQDKIYSYVGDILVAVNPFKPLTIYTQEWQNKYHNTIKSANPPHVFAIADQAYYAQRNTGKPQCAVISGESGAGKTESAKFLIRHIITLCHSGSEGAVLENKILQVNPLLEAFGNAQTLMNHNSSRFGKYTELLFNSKGAVVGAQISEYLLEKSRVVRQVDGECNFHIFYYLFAAREAGSLGLTSISDFAYTRNTRKMPPGYQKAYQEVEQALVAVGFAPDEEENLRKALACILHLGNISYDAVYSDLDPAQMSSDPRVLQTVAGLLGVGVDELKEALTVVVTVTRGETIRKPMFVEQANDCRDAFAKTVYGRVFGWMVSQINDLLAPSASEANKKHSTIGILDIFGFEHFQHNGFEQLNINLANEQLQHFFNQHIFQWELEEYSREGIDGSHISFQDNQPLLDLFLGKPIGIMALLDEESHFPKGTDESLVAKLKQQFAGKSDIYKAERTNDARFTISHYAGSVLYTADTFLLKNRDSLNAGVISLCQKSTNTLIKDIFLGEVSDTGNVVANSKQRAGTGADRRASQASRRSATVGAQFTASLKILMDKMHQCQAHFVRCIKPNTTQSASNFVPDFVQAQLRYTGMLETTRIRREGYSYRPRFEEFMERFGMLAYGVNSKVEPSQATCQRVLEVSQLKGWQLGRTKVFLKYWHVEQLDKQAKIIGDVALVFQNAARGFLARMRHRSYLAQVATNAQNAAAFMDSISRTSAHLFSKVQRSMAQDARNFASGALRQAPARAPPRPVKSEKDLKREASVIWWKEKEQPRGAGLDPYGQPLQWFHGIISRKEAERLLAPRNIGCFLVRVSENRFGYTLSYRITDRCRHYIVEQDTQGRYALVGVPKIADSLNDLIDYFRKNRINDAGEMLREPCGQEVNAAGEEQCDYGELMAPGARGYRQSFSGGGAAAAGPSVSRASKPSFGAADAPQVSRANKPSFGAADAPPSINRMAKPR